MLSKEGRIAVVLSMAKTINSASCAWNMEKKGHEFHTRTDTEVLIHSFEEEGIGFARAERHVCLRTMG
jgi:glucosamine 6-phosphate synthetase-like amidotransferase/phosphosugar isomerase protein